MARFHATHRARFSYAAEGERVEIVTLRAAAIGRLDKPEERRDAMPEAIPATTRRLWHDDAWREVPVHRREALREGEAVPGPAIIEEAFATHLITAGWTARLDPEGAVIARRNAA